MDNIYFRCWFCILIFLEKLAAEQQAQPGGLQRQAKVIHIVNLLDLTEIRSDLLGTRSVSISRLRSVDADIAIAFEIYDENPHPRCWGWSALWWCTGRSS